MQNMFDHFKSLNITPDDIALSTCAANNPHLNQHFSEAEILRVVKKPKNNKGCGPDFVLSERKTFTWELPRHYNFELFWEFFTTLITSFVETNNIIEENQSGFGKSYATIDHVFTLKTIIDIYLSR